VLLDFNDGVAVVYAEVGSLSFAVGLRVNVTVERLKKPYRRVENTYKELIF
jgi:hypothetical protein